MLFQFDMIAIFNNILKEYEASESRIPSLRAEFDKERSAMESHITSLRRQVRFFSSPIELVNFHSAQG